MFTLTDSECDSFKKELSFIKYDPSGDCDFINSLRLLSMKTLPKRILNFLIKQKTSLDPAPFFVIDNLPIDDRFFKTPFQNELNNKITNFKSGTISENVIMAISSLIGGALLN